MNFISTTHFTDAASVSWKSNENLLEADERVNRPWMSDLYRVEKIAKVFPKIETDIQK